VHAAIENISTMHYNNMQQKLNAAGPRSFHNQHHSDPCGNSRMQQQPNTAAVTTCNSSSSLSS